MARAIEHPGIFDLQGIELPSRLVEIAGVDTFVYDYGWGKPILFIHGYGDTADGWRKIIPELTKTNRVIAIDLPPFGRSEDPSRLRPVPRLKDFYTDFFTELYKSLKIKKATVVGHSLGGAMALELALEQPDLVDRLVVVAPAGLGAHPPLWWHFIAMLSRPMSALPLTPVDFTPGLVKRGIQGFVERFVVYDRKVNADTIGHLIDMHGTRKNLGKLLSTGKSMIGQYDGTLIERCADMKTPTLGIWGRNDALVPVRHADLFAEATRVVKTKIIDDCGHYPQIEAPDVLTRALKQFIRPRPVKKRSRLQSEPKRSKSRRKSAA